MSWHAEIKLYGSSVDPSEAPRIEIECCDDPTPVVGTRNSDLSHDLYCESCDRTYARLYPAESEQEKRDNREIFGQ